MTTLRFSLLACCALTLAACQNNIVDPTELLPSDAAGNLVLRDECGSPAADNSGITVKLSGTSYSAVTGPDGRFRFEDVPAGTYTMEVSKEGYVPAKLTDIHFRGKGVTVNDFGLAPVPEWSVSLLGARTSSFPAGSAVEVEVAWDLSKLACKDLPQQSIAFYFSDSPDVSNTNFKMASGLTPRWTEYNRISIPFSEGEMRAHGFAKGARVYAIAYPSIDDPSGMQPVTHEEQSRFVGAGRSSVIEFTAP